MILRDRQKIFVQRSVSALKERGNTLGVAPTGSGKTIMLSAVVGQILGTNGEKACILAHRDEITAQNIDKFLKINPGMCISIVDSRLKSWSGKTTFAMVQTLARKKNLEQMPPLEILVIDEAHHARAETYRRIIESAKNKNPHVKIYGVTATPNRGDGKSLREVFDNCADQITISEMIANGLLVRPKTFVIDLGVQDDLKRVRRIADEFDMNEVAEIMDRRPLTEEIVRHWRQKAGDKRTVVFCSNIVHAAHTAEAFRTAGIKAEFVTGETPEQERSGIFRRLDTGETQVLVNVAVATEGWDCPPVSCVVLLRPCSHKSTMIQMIGRGLRKIDPQRYPGLVKTECVVLDFGTSAIVHGCLEQEVDLESDEIKKHGEAPVKTCPKCKADVPIATRECPFCGHVFTSTVKSSLKDFEMAEIDLLRKSSFKWCPINKEGTIVMATGFEAWSGIFMRNNTWYAVGGSKDSQTKVLYAGDRIAALSSADDWLNVNETEHTAHKSRRWLEQPPTDKQILYMSKEIPATRYEASCMLSYIFNKWKIEHALSGFKL